MCEARDLFLPPRLSSFLCGFSPFPPLCALCPPLFLEQTQSTDSATGTARRALNSVCMRNGAQKGYAAQPRTHGLWAVGPRFKTKQATRRFCPDPLPSATPNGSQTQVGPTAQDVARWPYVIN